MANQVIQLYRNAFGGLSRAAWILALTMFINRSGSMVLPFLSVYLSGSLGLSIRQVGLIMSIYGMGSISGALLGGWLTDRFGHFHVQYLSLTIGGTLFFFVAGLTEFEKLSIGIFVLSMIIECLRPANASSIAYYARPENITRAFSLNRMAVNLGFSVGPALGGLIATISYTFLFYADGFTCISAGILFFLYFRNRKGNVVESHSVDESKKNISAYRDVPYLFFVLLSSIYAILFFQFIFTLPLFYRNVYFLSEKQIGGLLGFNGFMVFMLEMIMVYKIGTRVAPWKLIFLGLILTGFSFVLLNFGHGWIFLVSAMAILSISEILVMPYLATVSVQRAGVGNRGTYMGLYTFSYSAGTVLAPFLGTLAIDHYGFETLWWLVGLGALFAAFGFYLTLKKMK